MMDNENVGDSFGDYHYVYDESDVSTNCEDQENLDPKKSCNNLNVSRKRRGDGIEKDIHCHNYKAVTIPKTPMVLKRYQMLKMKRIMTNEEIAENQKREMKMQFAHKKIMAARDRKLANILKRRETFVVQPEKKFTEPIEFKFATNTRFKTNEPVAKIAETKEVDFFAGLRKHEGFNFNPSRTQFVPFVFHGKSEQTSVPKEKVETLAEKCNKFITKTPARFHTKSLKDLRQEKLLCNLEYVKKSRFTIAKTPKLLTKNRTRLYDIPSQADKEEAEYNEMIKNQFKATKLNKQIFTQCNLGIKKVAPKEITVPLNIEMGTERRTADRRKMDETVDSSANLSEEQFRFHAQPVPVKILQGPVGIKPRQAIPLTVPKSPEFSELHATKKKFNIVEEPTGFGIPKISAPPADVVPFKPQLEHRFVEPEPFSFELRDKEMLEKKEQKIKMVYEMENNARKFVANPLPDLFPVLPAKKSRPITVVEEFNLESEKRAALQHEKWQKSLEEERRKERESKLFKAKPASVLSKEPFVPEKYVDQSVNSLMSLTDEERHVPLNLEKRAVERQKWDRLLQEHQEELERQAIEKEKIRLEEEEQEIRKLRDQTIHQAQPIKHFKPVVFERGQKPLTEPESPNFSSRLTAKYEKRN